MLKYFLLWFPMIPIAIGNAILRESLYTKFLNELLAHQASTFSLLLLFGFYMFLVFRKWPSSSGKQAWSIGLMWFLLTIAFEFLFGHFIMGNPWSKLFNDYNFLHGRLWILIPLWLLLAPTILVYKHQFIPNNLQTFR